MPGESASVPLPGDDSETPDDENRKEKKKLRDYIPFKLQVGGYIEDTLTVEHLKGEGERLLNNARLRLDVSRKTERYFESSLSLIAQWNALDTELDMMQYLPRPDRLALQRRGMGEAFKYPLDEFEVYLQEAFAGLNTKYFRLRLGRQKFSSGTGYAFNPIDLFNVKNPLDPSYEVDGHDAVLASFELPRQTRIQLAAVFTDKKDPANHDIRYRKDVHYQARLTTQIEGWDLGLQYTYRTKKRMDWEELTSPWAFAGMIGGIFGRIWKGF